MHLTKALGVFTLAFNLAAGREIPIHDSRAVISLQQTLALYPLAIDSKNFAALDKVFAQDVVANYSAPLGVLSGLPAVISVLEASLAPVITQHALATFSVSDLKEDSASTVSFRGFGAEARKEFDHRIQITYYTANHFGKGVSEGQVYYAYGQYVDDWAVKGGSWKIVHRQQNYMGPGIGNISVFTG